MGSSQFFPTKFFLFPYANIVTTPQFSIRACLSFFSRALRVCSRESLIAHSGEQTFCRLKTVFIKQFPHILHLYSLAIIQTPSEKLPKPPQSKILSLIPKSHHHLSVSFKIPHFVKYHTKKCNKKYPPIHTATIALAM